MNKSYSGLYQMLFCIGVFLFSLQITPLAAQQSRVGPTQSSIPHLKILTKRIEPFVIYKNGRFSGFSIELWQIIAAREGWQYDFVLAPTLADLLGQMERSNADGAIAAISMTAERENRIDFSHPFFRSGLQILTRKSETGTIGQALSIFWAMVTSKRFAYGIIIFLLTVFAASNIIWLLERNRNSDFSKEYLPGLWDAFWWSVVTVTTVGYGDKAPKAHLGRAFALLWMVFGYFLFAYFTASITSTVTVRELQDSIRGPADLVGHKIAVIAKSTSESYANREFGTQAVVRVDHIRRAYKLLVKGKVDAVIHDAPVLLYYASHKGKGQVKTVGPIFQNESYAMVLPEGSPFREPVNRALLEFTQSSDYEKLYRRWFGDQQDQ